LLNQYGSIAYTEKVLKELNAKARVEIDRLGGNPFLIKILDESEELKHSKNLLL